MTPVPFETTILLEITPPASQIQIMSLDNEKRFNNKHTQKKI